MEILIPILQYHSIALRVSRRYLPFTLSPEHFIEQLRQIQKHGYVPVTVSQVAGAICGAGTALPTRPVVLTFDDGLGDFYTGAFPILQQFNFPATLYITTAYMGGTSRWLEPLGEGRRPMLTWQELREIADCGIECGAHSHHHVQLDTLLLSQARDEINRSKEILEEKLGRPVPSFSYPYGYHNNRVCQIVREAGYTSACAVKNMLSTTRDDPFALSRLILTPDLTSERFSRLLLGQGVPRAPRAERLQTRVWRMARCSAALLQRSLPQRQGNPAGAKN